MGYACPVCSALEADGEHLANHLAFTALLHGGDHEAWLDQHVPDWAARDPGGLAAVVVEHAEETEEAAFDEDGGTSGGHARHSHHGTPRELDPETRRIVEEAIELTRRRRAEDDREE